MEAISRILSERFLLELVLKGALLMTLAFAITFIFQRASAALRHAVWSMAFIGLLLLPFGSALLPAWQISIPEIGSKTSEPLATESRLPAAVATEPEVFSAPDVVVPSSAELPPAVARAADSAWSWTSVALLVWIAGAIMMLLRLTLVLVKLSVLRRSARPVTDPQWTDLAEILPEVLNIRRPILLLQHEAVVVPMTYGVRRPVILLPVHSDGWSEDQKHVTMMHELLHIRRFDHLVHILALSARALHWFNPLTWAATKRLIVERERACDDGVLAMGVASTSYADHLLGMARYVLSGKEASAAALAMARPSELRSRIVAILNPGQPRRALTGLRALGMAGCALAFVVFLSAMRPVEVSRSAPIEIEFKSEGDAVATESTSPQARSETEVDADAVESTVKTTPENEQLADTVDVEAQRRAIHAISELPEERAIPLLRDIAESHPNTDLREEAIFWLGQVGDGSTADLLESFARNDVSEEVQKKAIFALSEIDDAAGTQRLINLARSHPNSDMQAEAVFWLGQRGGSDVAGILADFARSGASKEIQKKAVFALSEIDGKEGVPHLITLARTHPDAEVRSEAIFWLGETGDPRAADVLMEIVNGK